MSNQNWDKYANAYNELAKEMIKVGIDTMKLRNLITLYGEILKTE